MANESKQLRILYYGAGWPTNIGNAFIDLGAIHSLRQALPEATIGFASEMPRWFFAAAGKSAKRKFMAPPPADRTSNALDIAAVTDCDLVVFSGMAMCEEFVRVNGPTIIELGKRNIPALLLGTGGLAYSEQEKRVFCEFMNKIKILGFISRDDDSWTMFSGTAGFSQKGIDCGFFVADSCPVMKLDLPPYVALNFDNMPEPVLDLKGRMLVRAHHSCVNPIKEDQMKFERTLISDIPQDYLTLYANADEVHSDRVHACVATLSFGRRARMYRATPRAKLFAAAGARSIMEKLTQIDADFLAEKKKEQIRFIKKAVSALK